MINLTTDSNLYTSALTNRVLAHENKRKQQLMSEQQQQPGRKEWNATNPTFIHFLQPPLQLSGWRGVAGANHSCLWVSQSGQGSLLLRASWTQTAFRKHFHSFLDRHAHIKRKFKGNPLQNIYTYSLLSHLKISKCKFWETAFSDLTQSILFPPALIFEKQVIHFISWVHLCLFVCVFVFARQDHLRSRLSKTLHPHSTHRLSTLSQRHTGKCLCWWATEILLFLLTVSSQHYWRFSNITTIKRATLDVSLLLWLSLLRFYCYNYCWWLFVTLSNIHYELWEQM